MATGRTGYPHASLFLGGAIPCVHNSGPHKSSSLARWAPLFGCIISSVSCTSFSLANVTPYLPSKWLSETLFMYLPDSLSGGLLNIFKVLVLFNAVLNVWDAENELRPWLFSGISKKVDVDSIELFFMCNWEYFNQSKRAFKNLQPHLCEKIYIYNKIYITYMLKRQS